MMCFSLGDHGHHPAHRFEPVSADASQISSRILSLCEAGRGLVHAAICDGCDKVSQFCTIHMHVMLIGILAYYRRSSQVLKLP